jgi:hypothetical protein
MHAQELLIKLISSESRNGGSPFGTAAHHKEDLHPLLKCSFEM